MEWRQSVDFFTRRNEVCGASSSQPVQAVSWCPLPVPSPRAFSAPQPPHSTLSWPQRAQAHSPAVSWLSLTSPVTLTQGTDFQQDQVYSEKCFRDIPYFMQQHLIAFGYSFFISFLSVTESGLWLLMMLIDWDSSKCQGRKLQPCDEQKPCGNGDVMLLSSR